MVTLRSHSLARSKWLVTYCINFLIVYVYTFAQHWDHIGTSDLLGKVWSGLVDYYCVSVTALNLLRIFVACLVVLVLYLCTKLYFSVMMVILTDSFSYLLAVWIASSLGDSTLKCIMGECPARIQLCYSTAYSGTDSILY